MTKSKSIDQATDAPKDEPKDAAKSADKPTTVRMERHLEGVDGPKEADVHPDEVENWMKHGWSVKKG